MTNCIWSVRAVSSRCKKDVGDAKGAKGIQSEKTQRNDNQIEVDTLNAGKGRKRYPNSFWRTRREELIDQRSEDETTIEGSMRLGECGDKLHDASNGSELIPGLVMVARKFEI